MPKSARSAGTQWGGLNKRVDPVDMPPEQSPDCANVFFYDQTVGLLGPRMGKAYAGASEYNIWGVFPYSMGGQIGSLVAYGDDTSTEINLLNLYSVTIPPGGWGDGAKDGPVPGAVVAITRNMGFIGEWDGPSDTGASCTDTVAVDVAINGSVWVTATLPSASNIVAEVELETWLQFDGGAWEQVNSGILAGGGCCGGFSITIDPTPVDTTAKTKLTGVRCTATELGNGSLTMSGVITVTGEANA